jgi:hypothetical protein
VSALAANPCVTSPLTKRKKKFKERENNNFTPPQRTAAAALGILIFKASGGSRDALCEKFEAAFGAGINYKSA